QHFNYLCGTPVAEELAQLLLVIRNAVSLDKLNEISGRVTREGRLTEVWVGGDEVVGGGVEISEVAAAAPGVSDLLSDAICMLEHDHSAATLAGFDGAEETGRSAAD